MEYKKERECVYTQYMCVHIYVSIQLCECIHIYSVYLFVDKQPLIQELSSFLYGM